MNDTSQATSTPGASLLPDGIAALTTLHFVLIGVLAILVIAGIAWGVRQKRVRDQAEQDVVANAEQAGVAPAPPESAPEPAPVPPRPAPTAPTAPAPPRIAERPAPGTPATPDPIVDEPVPAASEADRAVETVAPAPVPAPVSTSGDAPVTVLKGLGPKVAARLAELGVTNVGQIAALSPSQAEALDAQLGAFTGRMHRDRWIEQARFLAAGDKAGFEAAFGRL